MSRSEQLTELERIASFADGLIRGRQPIASTLTVGNKDGVRKPVVVKLSGEMTRLIPKDLTNPVKVAPSAPDPRPLTLPDAFMVDGLKAKELYPALYELLSDKRMLGAKGARKAQAALKHHLSEMQLAANFRNMIDEDGSTTLRITNKRKPREVIEVTIQARATDRSVTLMGRKETEIGRVRRIQRMIDISIDQGRTFSLSRVTRFFGVTRNRSAGWRVSVRTSVGSGLRLEESLFGKGTAAGIKVPAVFDVTSRKIVDRGGRERVNREIKVSGAATGTVDLTVFESDLKAMDAQRGVEGRREWGWNLDMKVRRDPERPGWRARWRHTPRPADAPPIDLDLLSHRTANRLRVAPATGVTPDAGVAPGTGLAPDAGVAPDTLYQEMAKAVRERRSDGGTSGTPIRITAKAAWSGQASPVTRVRLLARALGTDVWLEVREPDGTVRPYRASPDGKLHSEVLEDGTRPNRVPDGGFASAFAVLSPSLLARADEAGMDLRSLYNRSPEEGDFAGRVDEELGRPGGTIVSPTPGRPQAVGPEPSRGTPQRVGPEPGRGTPRGGSPEPGGDTSSGGRLERLLNRPGTVSVPQPREGSLVESLLNRPDGHAPVPGWTGRRNRGAMPEESESEFWARMRRTTGYSDGEEKCVCPPGEPCTCGLRPLDPEAVSPPEPAN